MLDSAQAEELLKEKLFATDHPPFIIAEMSGNHGQSLEQALAIVDATAEAGADAIKLQTYTADTMTLNIERPEFTITDPNSLWSGRHLYELYQEAHTPWDWHQPIMQRAAERGLFCFSTPFDDSAVDFLETLNAPAYKIASFENTDIHLLKRVIKTGKPIIVSTGLATLADLQLIVQTLRDNSCDNFILLKCTSAYPASPADANLRTIPHLARMFNCQVGLSDHTEGIGVPIAAIALGATIIEKHFCLSRAAGGVDAAFSLEPAELALLVEEAQRAHQALGQVEYQRAYVETQSKQFRRTLYFAKPLEAGEMITPDCIRRVRPGYGLAPKYLDSIIGKRVRVRVDAGAPVTWPVLEMQTVED